MKISISFNPFGYVSRSGANGEESGSIWIAAGLLLAIAAAVLAVGIALGNRSLPMTLDILRLFAFPALMAYAASSDLFTMTISNRVSLALVAGFVAVAAGTGMGWSEVGWHFIAAGSVLAVCFGFFARGWIGGGDAKLAAATALWLGFDHLLDYVLYASLLGGALTLVLLQFRMLPLPAFLREQPWLMRLHEKNGGIPYGIALACAALIVYPHTGWMNFAGLLPS